MDRPTARFISSQLSRDRFTAEVILLGIVHATSSPPNEAKVSTRWVESGAEPNRFGRPCYSLLSITVIAQVSLSCF